MKKFLNSLFIKLTGGRPMRKIEFAFTDVVSGAKIYYFEDKFGSVWLAEGQWAIFRVKCQQTREELNEMIDLFPDTWASE